MIVHGGNNYAIVCTEFTESQTMVDPLVMRKLKFFDSFIELEILLLLHRQRFVGISSQQRPLVELFHPLHIKVPRNDQVWIRSPWLQKKVTEQLLN